MLRILLLLIIFSFPIIFKSALLTLSKLEENSEKVAEVNKSVQKFEKISEKLQNLPN